MVRTVGRVGGASAGVIAIVFGVLEQLHKVPPPWIPIALGAVAVVGVLADYGLEKNATKKADAGTKQTQELGDDSVGFQAGRDNRDIDLSQLKPKGVET